MASNHYYKSQNLACSQITLFQNDYLTKKMAGLWRIELQFPD
jgi:hypothetical protein